ncbi:hypothetical protein [Botrimarina mediterranea]|uniref:hypothetical protein n=1 Tax=Botrimarina mediterranea TaxID=2528022 RepID=UPI00118CAD63|nr:Archaeal TRASH domain protein [Planctomycetes bacterium K2D]
MMTYKWMVAMTITTALAANASAQHDHAAHDHGANELAADAMPAMRPEAPPIEKSAVGSHGGQLHAAGAVQLETVVEPGGLRLFAYNAQGQAIDVRNARGVATLQMAGDAKRYRYDLFPEVRQDQSAEALGVAVDLSRIAGQEIDLNFQLAGLVAGERQPTQFTASAQVPMTEAQQVAASIAEQKVCPVSGQPLGAMGKPIPVTIGDKTIYVCCEGCIAKVKANPAKYFAAKTQLTVAPATAADAAAIALQKVCPVMDEPLGGMGTPLKVTGLRRDIYLCCKGCLKMLEKDPEKYLAMLPPLPESAKPEVVKATAADARFVAAQRICPVMDGPLDGMGGPYKTVVEGRVVYLCCPGCAKKLHANPGVYLDKLAKLGVTPPTVK